MLIEPMQSFFQILMAIKNIIKELGEMAKMPLRKVNEYLRRISRVLNNATVQVSETHTVQNRGTQSDTGPLLIRSKCQVAASPTRESGTWTEWAEEEPIEPEQLNSAVSQSDTVLKTLPPSVNYKYKTVFRIVVLGIWDYIENKVEVFDGAVIVLSLAPMVASTVANGPSSPWDAISLIITLRIWRVKRIIDAYVVPVKVEMEMVIQQYEKAKAVREEQLDRLTQICQEQAFEIRQLRAHLAQQDLDLTAEREAAMQIQHVWNKQSSKFEVVDGLATGESDDEGTNDARETRQPQEPVGRDDMNNYISQYYSEPSSDMAVPEVGMRVITTTAIDVHLPSNPHNISSDLLTVETPGKLERMGSSVSDTSGTASRSTDSSTTRNQSVSSQTFGSSTDCSTNRESSSDYCPLERMVSHYNDELGPPSEQKDTNAVVQELLSSLSEDSCLTQKGLDPVNLKLPSPTGSTKASPVLEHRVNIYNKKNQENLSVLQSKPIIHLQGSESALEEKYRFLESDDGSLNRLSETQ
ncbi:TM266 protein, partial [Polypterus senegalus]